MAFLGKGKKQDMLQLAEELGINATLNMTVPSIKIAITNSEGYEEEFVKNLYETIIANGKRLEELERAEKNEIGRHLEGFHFEITNYLDEWLIGLEINTFQDLKDLMVVDQLKKRANASMKDHFLDNWANLKSATQIAELFDNYEDVRKLIKGNLGYNFLPVEILNAVQTRSQVKAAREERGIDSGDAKKGEDEVIIVSSDAEDEILIPALQEYVPELALLRVTRENLINAQKIARRLNPYTNRQPVKCRLPIRFIR
ncbi:uncharacterized protein TNCV_2483781 [Trichonephila clavipes]|uniref:Uncharacterized protein n=1 Tax=Trichonephila clavipes TaxID=2585209 RepID=A0A8X6VZH7_TRICX|nr:uncharacterized protein TNCV_2483781 [Trichonephila clavipes]